MFATDPICASLHMLRQHPIGGALAIGQTRYNQGFQHGLHSEKTLGPSKVSWCTIAVYTILVGHVTLLLGIGKLHDAISRNAAAALKGFLQPCASREHWQHSEMQLFFGPCNFQGNPFSFRKVW